jgi:osmotically-inducible protein OsmY
MHAAFADRGGFFMPAFVPRFRWRALLCLALLYCFSPQSGAAEPGRPHSALPPPPAFDVHDARLTLEARRLILQDRELARFNLGVSINQGVAVVWGRVPSETLARRALEHVRQIRGIFEVHEELQILPFEFGTEPPDNPPERRDLNRVVSSPGALMGRTGRKPPVVVDPAPIGAAVTLLPPVPATVACPPAKLDPPAVLLPPATSALSASLESAVEQLRRSDRRFEQVRAEVRQGTVYLSGTGARTEDIRELAQQVSRLPGVAGVVIEHLPVNSPRH